jgi:dTDP-4-dehydrorhamnose 3,5-epimerase-like enzyme
MKISGLQIIETKLIKDEKGYVNKWLFKPFNAIQSIEEVYFSMVNINVTKGWKLHNRIHQNLYVISGKIEFTFIDFRKDSKSYQRRQVIVQSESDYCYIHIPSGVAYKFRNIHVRESLIVNAIDEPYDNAETETFPLELF